MLRDDQNDSLKTQNGLMSLLRKCKAPPGRFFKSTRRINVIYLEI